MGRIVALAGGVGGARMADGLAQAAGASKLSVIVNTADDFEHLGFPISPDIDTVTYTLAGLDNRELGWGRRDETWAFMEALERLGGETWFRLGDRDLALHARRRQLLADGLSLSGVTERIAASFGIESTVIPMSDAPVRTMVDTEEGTLEFQHYFVRRRCVPRLRSIRFAGAAVAAAAPGGLAAFDASELAAIILCPSNPYVSVAPILAVNGYSQRLRARRVPAVAVSPIIGGRAVKGPASKMMSELGIEPSALAIAQHYKGLIDGLVIDTVDAAQTGSIEAEGIAVHVTDAVMRDRAGRMRLAGEALAFASQLKTP